VNTVFTVQEADLHVCRAITHVKCAQAQILATASSAILEHIAFFQEQDVDAEAGITTMDRLKIACHVIQIAPLVSEQLSTNATVASTLNFLCQTKPNVTTHVLTTVLITLQERFAHLVTQIACIA
jgi:hypothetical protein